MLQNRQLQKLHFCFFNPWSMDLKIQASLRMNVTSNAVVWNVTTVRSITHLLEEIEFPTPKTLNLYITPKPTNQKKKKTPQHLPFLPICQQLNLSRFYQNHLIKSKDSNRLFTVSIQGSKPPPSPCDEVLQRRFQRLSFWILATPRKGCTPGFP